MLRRDFLACLAAGSAFAGLSGNAFAYVKRKRKVASLPHKLDRVAISTWSLHNYFRSTRESNFNLPGPLLALLDFPEMVVHRYDVHRFEFCSAHFPSVELAFLKELKYTLSHSHSTIVNLLVDLQRWGTHATLSDSEPDSRLEAVEAAKEWVDIAHALGVKSITVGPGKVDPGNLTPTVESYHALSLYALAKSVQVLIENHGAFGTENPEDLVRLVKLAGPGRVAALPDFANFPNELTRQNGLKLLFGYAPTVCHATGLEFGANGTETAYEFPQAMAIAETAGFRGTYSVVFDGPGDPYAGIQKTLDELLRYL